MEGYHHYLGVFGDVVVMGPALKAVENVLQWLVVRECVADGDSRYRVIDVLSLVRSVL